MTRVGIFFLVEGSWLIDAVPVHEGERYGDALGHGGHYDYWAALRPRTAAERRFAGHDYDFFPRAGWSASPRRGPSGCTSTAA